MSETERDAMKWLRRLVREFQAGLATADEGDGYIRSLGGIDVGRNVAPKDVKE